MILKRFLTFWALLILSFFRSSFNCFCSFLVHFQPSFCQNACRDNDPPAGIPRNEKVVSRKVRDRAELDLPLAEDQRKLNSLLGGFVCFLLITFKESFSKNIIDLL